MMTPVELHQLAHALGYNSAEELRQELISEYSQPRIDLIAPGNMMLRLLEDRKKRRLAGDEPVHCTCDGTDAGDYNCPHRR